MTGRTLPLGLDAALSLDDGRALLERASPNLTEDDVAALAAAAAGAREAGDLQGAADLEEWRATARAVLAWRVLLERAPTDLEDARRRISVAVPDDAFFDVGLDTLSGALAAAAKEVAGAQGVADARVWILDMAAEITGQPAHVARAAYAAGIRQWYPQAIAEQAGKRRDEQVLAQAGEYFGKCAEIDEAPLRLRVESLANLAWIAGRDEPDKIAAFQRRSEQLQAGSPDCDLDMLRTVRRDMAWWAAKRENDAEVLRLHEANIADTERELFPASSYNFAVVVTRGSAVDYDGATAAALRLGENAAAVELAEDGKARAFTHALSVLAAGPSASPFLLRRRQRIDDELAGLGHPAATSGAAEGPRRARLSELIDAWARNEQRLRGPVLARDLRLLTRRSVDDIRRLLPASTGYLSYYWVPGHLVIAVVGPDGLVAPPVEVEVPLDELGDDRVGRAAFNVWMSIQLRGDFRSSDQIQQLLGERMEMFWPDQFLRYLYTQLIAPVAGQLVGFRSLVISPHGRLRGLPFHCLTAADGRTLLEDYAVSYTDGARMLAYCREHANETPGRGYVAATSAASGGPAAAEAEAAEAARLLGTRTHAATRNGLLIDAASAGLMHLACHTDYRSPVSSQAGLAVEDGIVTGNDIRSRTLSASLVVLSACMTAALDIDPLVTADEMNGLVGAFLQAGVPAVAATLWPLPDRVAPLFASSFYSALSAHRSPIEALQTAQLAVKAQFPHPYYWAPFTLWGDGLLPLRMPSPDEQES